MGGYLGGKDVNRIANNSVQRIYNARTASVVRERGSAAGADLYSFGCLDVIQTINKIFI